MTGPRMTGPAAIPAALIGYPVAAWIPSRRHDGEWVAVLRRTDPECVDAPYATTYVRRAGDGWRCFDGVYDLATLPAAFADALTTAGWTPARTR